VIENEPAKSHILQADKKSVVIIDCGGTNK
jgi:hypothetical protein